MSEEQKGGRIRGRAHGWRGRGKVMKDGKRRVEEVKGEYDGGRAQGWRRER